MKREDNRIGKVIVWAVLALLVFCTFAARPLKAYRMPTVTAAVVRERRMEYTEDIQTDGWYSGNKEDIALRWRLDTPLQVENVYAENAKCVSKGDILLTFQAASGEYAIINAENALLQARAEADAYRRQIENRMLELQSEILSLQEQIAELTGAERENRVKMLALRREELDAVGSIEDPEQILNGRKLREAEEKYEYLMQTRENGWSLCSPRDGYAQDLNAAPGQEYWGPDVLLSVYSANDGLELKVPVSAEWKDVIRGCGVNAEVDDGNGAFPIEWNGMENGRTGLVAVFTVESEYAGRIGRCIVHLSAASREPVLLIPRAMRL